MRWVPAPSATFVPAPALPVRFPEEPILGSGRLAFADINQCCVDLTSFLKDRTIAQSSKITGSDMAVSELSVVHDRGVDDIAEANQAD